MEVEFKTCEIQRKLLRCGDCNNLPLFWLVTNEKIALVLVVAEVRKPIFIQFKQMITSYSINLFAIQLVYCQLSCVAAAAVEDTGPELIRSSWDCSSDSESHPGCRRQEASVGPP